MRGEVENWYKQAKIDLDAAKKILNIEQYYVSCFLSQQAAEKSLKALYIHITKELPPHTHNLIEIGTSLKCPSEIMVCLRELNPAYTVSRYPNAANGIPAEQYDKEIAQRHIKCAEKVVSWVDDNLFGEEVKK